MQQVNLDPGKKKTAVRDNMGTAGKFWKWTAY